MHTIIDTQHKNLTVYIIFHRTQALINDKSLSKIRTPLAMRELLHRFTSQTQAK